MMSSTTDAIRSLNDRFRSNIPNAVDVPGRVMLTSGIHHLVDDDAEPNEGVAELLKRVREFDAFDNSNDPHSEHDFGALDFKSERVFWKIDYYAPDLRHGSSDASDTSITVRVLTIMLASEY